MSQSRTRPNRLGLRGRVVFFFALGAGLISLIIAISVFTLSRSYMLDQRERSAARQAKTHAEFVRNSLSNPGAAPDQLLRALETPVDWYILLKLNDQWFSAEPVISPTALPKSIASAGPGPVTINTTFRGKPYLAIAIPLDNQNATLYELAPVIELHTTLRILRLVLFACAAAAAIGGAGLGYWASGRVLKPLHQLGKTTSRIAGGDLDTRLPATGDRELIAIVDSFNTMVDSLQERIERERRFFGDVSHELRTPLTTLVASVGVLVRHSRDMPDRSQRAVELIDAEVHHLRHLLDDLLALARIDAGLNQEPRESLSLSSLLVNVLTVLKKPAGLLQVDSDVVVSGRKTALERAFVNLIANADQHGGGLTGITVARETVWIDDCGPGVPASDRSRVFERFATGTAARKNAAGSGTGLGLALVAETVAAHGATVECTDRPGGGARFVVRFPVS